MPFLLNYYEISQFPERASLLFVFMALYVMIAGLLSIQIKWYFVILVYIITIITSVLLSSKILVPPNESWFNPFTLEVAVIIQGIFIIVGVLIVRLIVKVILKKNN